MEDSIGMLFREIGWEGMDWMHLAQDTDQWLVYFSFSPLPRQRWVT
jgi:hypothetical protein